MAKSYLLIIAIAALLINVATNEQQSDDEDEYCSDDEEYYDDDDDDDDAYHSDDDEYNEDDEYEDNEYEDTDDYDNEPCDSITKSTESNYHSTETTEPECITIQPDCEEDSPSNPNPDDLSSFCVFDILDGKQVFNYVTMSNNAFSHKQKERDERGLPRFLRFNWNRNTCLNMNNRHGIFGWLKDICAED